MTKRKNKYAARTRVPVEQSRAEVEKLLRKHGAQGFSSSWFEGRSRVEFFMKDLRFRIDLPAIDHINQTEQQVAQDERQQWRALILILKSKFEAIESGFSIVEEEFLPYVVLPDGQKIGGRLIPVLPAVAEGSAHLSLEKPK